MNRQFCVLAFLAIVFGATVDCSAQDGFRKFHDTRGRSIEARLVSVDGEQLTLEIRDGRKFVVQIKTLSEDDQKFVRGAGRKPAAPATADKPAAPPADDAPPKSNKPSAPPSSGAGQGASVDWSRFRGPDGSGVANVAAAPLEWSVDKNLVWKTPLPGAGASSPVTFGAKIFLTCYTGYFLPGESSGSLNDLQRRLLAINASDGQIVWDKAVSAKLPEEEKIRDHGYAASTPVVDAERVYVFFGKTGVLAFDHDGQQLWLTDVGSKTNGWGSGTSPLLHKDLVIVNASVESQALVALDRKTGKERWRAEGIRESWNTPVVVTAESGRQELIVAIQGKVLAFAPDTGEPLWSCNTDIGWYMAPSVVAADGVVYALGGRSGVAALAVRAGGSGDVTETHRLWTSVKGSNVSSPVYHDRHLYWVNDSRGVAYCANAATGEILYEERLERAGQVYAAALLAAGRIYYVSREGRTFVLAAKPQFEQLAMNELLDRSVFNASPAMLGERLLIRSDKFLYCIGER